MRVTAVAAFREFDERALADAFRRNAKAGHADPGFSFVGGELLHPAVHAEAKEQHQLGISDRSGELRAGFHRVRVAARRRETDDVEIRPGQRAREVVERKEAGNDLRWTGGTCNIFALAAGRQRHGKNEQESSDEAMGW